MEVGRILSAEAAGFMALGGAVALVGVWLMLLEGAVESAKIALFGMELQAAPLGFAVFVAGSAATIAPIVEPDATSRMVKGALSATGLTEVPIAVPPLVIPPEASRRDYEPSNDQMAAAGLIKIGEMVSGTHSGEDWDWYLLGTENLQGRAFQVAVTNGSRACDVFYFDWQWQFAGGTELRSGTVGAKIPVGSNPGIFIQFACPQGTEPQPYIVSFEAADPVR